MKRALLHFTIASLSIVASVRAFAQCPDPFISEIVEGSGDTLFVEIYNPSASPLDMDYFILRSFPNGSPVTIGYIELTGMLPAGATMTVDGAQLINAGMELNGDDALTLEWSAPVPPYNYIVDIFGEPGVDPGAGWTDDETADFTDAGGATPLTRDHTLRRRPEVDQGVHVCCPSPFDLTLEWDVFPLNNVTGLGTHTAVACGSAGLPTEQLTSLAIELDDRGDHWVIRANDPLTAVQVFASDGRVAIERSANGRRELRIERPALSSGLHLIRVGDASGRSAVLRLVAP